jgi:hypothetical protein
MTPLLLNVPCFFERVPGSPLGDALGTHGTFHYILFSFFSFSYLSPLRVEADNHVSVFWPGEKAAFEGTVTSVDGAVGSRKIRVEFLDGEIEDFEEDADSFDQEDWLMLDQEPEEGRHAHNWSWKDVPEGAQQFLRRHFPSLESCHSKLSGAKHRNELP